MDYEPSGIATQCDESDSFYCHILVGVSGLSVRRLYRSAEPLAALLSLLVFEFIEHRSQGGRNVISLGECKHIVPFCDFL